MLNKFKVKVKARGSDTEQEIEVSSPSITTQADAEAKVAELDKNRSLGGPRHPGFDVIRSEAAAA